MISNTPNPDDSASDASAHEDASSGITRFRRGITERTHKLAWDAATLRSGNFIEEARLHDEYTPPEGLSPALQSAHRFSTLYPRLTPLIYDGELIVGAKVQSDEEPDWGWSPQGTEDYVGSLAALAPTDRPDIQAMAQRGLISPAGTFNHKVVDFKGFIRTGSAAIAKQAREIARTKEGAQRDFANAIAIGHETMIEHAATYVTACEELAKAASPERAQELLEIARICSKVPASPAETLHEAIQSLWFAYMIAGDGVGRPDVYLNDFYQADLAAGRITPERAQELIENFLCKLHGDYISSLFNVSSVQTMTLAGQHADGSDATNDLTRLFLQAMRNVRLMRPTTYIRCHENTPEDVLTLAATMLGEGLAEPSFYGDKPIIEGLVRNGIPLEVARDYALSGCTEVISPGRGNWGAVNGWVNIAMLADDSIRECAVHDNPTPELLWEILEQRADDLAQMCRDTQEWRDNKDTSINYSASMLMPCCLERCADPQHGGAESALGQWEAMGLPNAADMLYAAEQAMKNGEDLGGLLKRVDEEDSETMTRLRALPKFGNDCEDLDELGARLIRVMSDSLEKRSTPLRSSLVLGHLAGGENMHIPYGRAMGPTLDGRTKGQTLADSLAGSHGCTTSGPTALIRSLCRIDHSRIIAGNVSTLRLSPAEFATPEAISKVVALIQTFVAMGGSQLQINVTDAATLRLAQEHPEEHRGLLVRVAGYSADFSALGTVLQDEIIARTEGLANPAVN